MDSFRFAHPEALYLLLLVPLILVLMMLFARQRKKALEAFGELGLLSHLMPDFSTSRSKLKATLFLVALTLQILVVASPQFGSKFQTVKRQGIELMVALDVSNSMNAQDVSPSRLETAKMAISRLVDKLGGDKVGLVVFAGNAYTQLPMTSDYASAKMFMQSVSTGMVPTQGTAIGTAINRCRVSFSQTEGVNRAIVVKTTRTMPWPLLPKRLKRALWYSPLAWAHPREPQSPVWLGKMATSLRTRMAMWSSRK